MDDTILNLEQTVELLGISEKTLIKLLREEHIPARKIGREWRFSKNALIEWLSGGDSLNYINRSDAYLVSQDEPGTTAELFERINAKMARIEQSGNLKGLLPLDKEIELPAQATLRVSYKQQRDVEKLEFKIYWPMREEYKGLGRNEPGAADTE